MIATVIEAMQQQRSTADAIKHVAPVKPSSSKLFFDTNSLHELVKRAGQLRDSLAETVRRAELLTQTPISSPRVEPPKSRHNLDGSPAFTRVFTDPSASPQGPQRRLPKSHSTNSVLRRKCGSLQGLLKLITGHASMFLQMNIMIGITPIHLAHKFNVPRLLYSHS